MTAAPCNRRLKEPRAGQLEGTRKGCHHALSAPKRRQPLTFLTAFRTWRPWRQNDCTCDRQWHRSSRRRRLCVVRRHCHEVCNRVTYTVRPLWCLGCVKDGCLAHSRPRRHAWWRHPGPVSRLLDGYLQLTCSLRYVNVTRTRFGGVGVDPVQPEGVVALKRRHRRWLCDVRPPTASASGRMARHAQFARCIGQEAMRKCLFLALPAGCMPAAQRTYVGGRCVLRPLTFSHS